MTFNSQVIKELVGSSKTELKIFKSYINDCSLQFYTTHKVDLSQQKRGEWFWLEAL